MVRVQLGVLLSNSLEEMMTEKKIVVKAFEQMTREELIAELRKYRILGTAKNVAKDIAFLDALFGAGVDSWEGYEVAQEMVES